MTGDLFTSRYVNVHTDDRAQALTEQLAAHGLATFDGVHDHATLLTIASGICEPIMHRDADPAGVTTITNTADGDDAPRPRFRAFTSLALFPHTDGTAQPCPPALLCWSAPSPPPRRDQHQRRGDALTAAEGAGIRHLERVDWAPRETVDLDRWPFTVPAIAQLVTDGGLDIPAGVTVLVGENGSGKSTLVEALATAYPRHGAAHKLTGANLHTDEAPLARHLLARTHPMASPHGFFLRAETMRDYLVRVDDDPTQARAWDDPGRLLERSHGESFLTVLRNRFADVGVYFMDEPEAALSFRSCLGLLSLLDTMGREGCQVIVATHSPLLAALPSATLLEVGDNGLRRTAFDELDLVRDWRDFLDTPQRWLRHLLE